MRKRTLALIVLPLLLPGFARAEAPAVGPGVAWEQATPATPVTGRADPALDTAIADILGEDAASTRTVVRRVGEAEGRLALVYLVGQAWCGSGGCNLLILRPTDAGWQQIGDIARVRPPVRLLTTSSHGLPDLGVTVSGGGGPPAYEARVSFDGRTYPRFPSDEPLVDAAGTTIISTADLPAPAD